MLFVLTLGVMYCKTRERVVSQLQAANQRRVCEHHCYVSVLKLKSYNFSIAFTFLFC
jgi:hypothetical protein